MYQVPTSTASSCAWLALTANGKFRRLDDVNTILHGLGVTAACSQVGGGVACRSQGITCAICTATWKQEPRSRWTQATTGSYRHWHGALPPVARQRLAAKRRGYK